MKYPVNLSANRRDGGPDGVRRVEVLRPDDLADARDLVRDQDAAAADRDQRAVLPRGLHPVDRVGEHLVRAGQRRAEQLLVAGGAAALPSGPPRRDRAVGQRGRRPAEYQRLAPQPVADTVRPDADAVLAGRHYRAAAEGDGDQVGHPEVGANAADLDPVGGFPGKPVDQHADVRGGAADVAYT